MHPTVQRWFLLHWELWVIKTSWELHGVALITWCNLGTAKKKNACCRFVLSGLAWSMRYSNFGNERANAKYFYFILKKPSFLWGNTYTHPGWFIFFPYQVWNFLSTDCWKGHSTTDFPAGLMISVNSTLSADDVNKKGCNSIWWSDWESKRKRTVDLSSFLVWPLAHGVLPSPSWFSRLWNRLGRWRRHGCLSSWNSIPWCASVLSWLLCGETNESFQHTHGNTCNQHKWQTPIYNYMSTSGSSSNFMQYSYLSREEDHNSWMSYCTHWLMRDYKENFVHL
jgi:hypothetical protein